jgi:fructose-bisphosphate aldolase class I
MSGQELDQTIAQLVVPGKGILAADESAGTIGRRLAAVEVASTGETRRSYRNLLFTTPGLNEFISGVILFEETLQQKSDAEIPFARLLADQGMVPGIKVDKGTVALAHFPGDKITEGLDGLAERLAGYKQLGARFAKWRAVFTIGAGLPSTCAVEANANALARYAAICQEAGVVPIVEPEVLMDGDHTIESCEYVTQEVLEAVFHALHRHRVILERMLLKPNMVVPGKDCAMQASPEQVAAATLAVLRRSVPAAVPGINFLSGGQSNLAATANLNALNTGAEKRPWQLSFSYARALQSAALKAWRGEAANKAAGQQALYQRARLNSLAQQGKYTVEMEG